MRKGLTTLLVILLAVGALLVSCNANVEAPADELVTISFDNESSRALSSNLETFTPGAYYWKYAAKKADSSNLISGQTADYDSDPESGALWIKEGEPGFGETSGQVYTPFKVQGFSQGLWNFRLFGYKKVIGDNPATTEVVETDFEYYLLAYSGETTGVLLKQNGTNLVKAIVSPTQTGNGTLVVKITGSDKITLDPATPGLIPNTKIKLKVEKITSTATTTVFEDFVTEDYNESLEAGTYKVTVKFTNDDASVEFASGSVVSTVYANLTTTVKGNLTEVITSAIFGAEQNPDIITTSIGTASITQGTTESSVTFTSTTETKVAATMPTAAAKSLIAEMEQALDAKTSSSTSQTSDLTLNLSVNTTEATETTVTYEIGMEATLIYEKKDAQASQKTTTKSTVETLDDFVTVVIDLRANLQDVSVMHSGTVMTECESLDILNGKTKAQDTTGIGFYFYDSASGKLYIKTWKFSPFQLSYTVPSYFAAIGSTMYESLTAAITAAEAGDTILILKDITTDDGYLVGKTISIDTNGHTITVNEGSNINNRAFKVTGGKLTVFGNGKIVAVGSGTTSSDGAGCYGAFRVESAGQLDVSDMTLINARPWGLNVKVCGGEVTLTNVTINSSYGGGIEVTEANLGTQSKKGSATLTDCTFTQTGYFDHCSTTLSVSGGSELIVNSGSYTSDNYALYVFSSGGVITVKGGTFSGAYGNDDVAIKAAIDTSTYPQYTGGLAISGGTFTGGYEITSPAYMVLTGGSYNVDPTAYVAEGYIADYNTQTSRWTIREATEDDYVASITRGEITKKYFTLPKAVEDAVSGDEILLLKDIELTSTLHITKSLTINGGSQKKTLSATSEYFNFSNWDKKNTILIYGSEGNPISVDLKNLGLSTTVRGIVYLDYVSGVVTNVSAVSTGSCPIWAGNGDSQGTVSVVLNDCEMVDDNSVTTGDSTWARSGAAAMTGADLTINGGSYTGYYGIYVFSSGGRITVNEPAGKETSIVGTNQAVRHDNSEYNNCSEFVINGGSFNGPIYLQDDHPENVSISISGGTFTNVEYPYSAFGKFITGGTFDADPSAYVAKGYGAIHHPAEGSTPEYWTVEPRTKLITNMSELKEYITGNYLIGYVGADITVDEAMELDGDKELYLYDYTFTITNNNSRPFVLNNNQSMTVNAGKGGMLIPSDSSAYGFFRIQGSESELTLNGGSYRKLTDEASALIWVGPMNTGHDNSVVLNGITGECVGLFVRDLTSYNIGTNNYPLNTLIVNGGNFKFNNDGVNVGGSVSGFLTTHMNVEFDGATIVSDIGAIIEIDSGTGVFKNNNFTVQKENTIQSWNATTIGVSYDADVTIESGSYTAFYGASLFSHGGTLTINGGTITGTSHALYLSADTDYSMTSTCVINGGTINGDICTYNGDVTVVDHQNN